MSGPTILFFGYGSEYSLHPLFDFMSKRGDTCVEVDMLTEPDCIGKLRGLEGRPLIFATSAHPLYDQQNFFYYRTERKIVSALHVMSTLKPKLSVFYPHDYKDPIKEEEVPYLPLFDLLLWPFHTAPTEYERLVRTIPVGWIKNPAGGRDSNSSASGKTVFFLGAYQFYLHAGMEKFFLDFAPILKTGISVKLPRWHDNLAFETFLRGQGVDVIPSEANSIEIMKSCDTVITHALSSVGVEACHLGKKVIYIRDPKFDYKDPTEAFRDAGNISFVDSPETAAELPYDTLVPNTPTMKEFEFAAARDAILQAYQKRVTG